MVTKFFVPVLLLLSLMQISTAQDLNKQVLMTVDGREISAGEFMRMYKKSYDPGNLQDLDSYLEQYKVFRLKVADAVNEGMDTNKAFHEELQGYRNQLARNYLTDTVVKNRLLKQAYQRSMTEINAWHILIALPPEASPEDTLKAWNKAMDIRERIKLGESFEQVARSTSDDPTVKMNGGNLGYVTAFQMIMPFEDAVYKLKPGALSYPVRTPYGYHIIMVTNKRPSSGKIKVAHIMKALMPGANEKEAKAAEDTIWSVYRQLTNGADFGQLAMKYSDHRESATHGGELNWFGAGEIIPDFAEAALALKNNGDFTLPVRTPYGWHIIKRLDIKPPGTFEESRSYLESKIDQSYLNSLSKKSFVDKLKKEYHYKLNLSTYDWFIANTDTMIIVGKSKYSRAKIPSGPVYTFADQKLTANEFADYIEKRGSMINTRDPENYIMTSLETCLEEQIINYENSLLETKYPEFRYLMNEFHDGILLFDISNKKIWKKSQQDTAGMKRYYEDNKENYLTREAFTGSVYLLRKKDGMKQLVSSYRKYRRFPDSDSQMIKKFTVRGDTLIKIKKGTWSRGDDESLEGVDWKEGIHQTTIGTFPAIIVIDKVLKPEPLPFSEVQGEVMSSYQDYLENQWIEQLKEEYTVKVNENVLEAIKKSLGNE
jgi:peptidyl-prolyl cis-trans isomerase SurA